MMNWLIRSRQSSPETSDAVVVNVASVSDLLEDLEHRMIGQRGFSVATLNLDHVVKLRDHSAFRKAYRAHSHITADGNPIVWLARMAGQKVTLAPGSELIEPLVALAARHDIPVAFLGSTQETLDKAAARLLAQHPGLRIVARIAPPMGFVSDGPTADAAIATLEASGARLCFIALGAPKQEIFAAYAQNRLSQTGFLSIGAGLDFIAGTQPRAPLLVRRVASEWLWRLAMNPGRLAGRYAACIAILPQLTLQAYRARDHDAQGEPGQ